MLPNNEANQSALVPMTPLLTTADLERLLKIDRRTISRLCKAGLFPKPVRLGGQNRWRHNDVANAIEIEP